MLTAVLLPMIVAPTLIHAARLITPLLHDTNTPAYQDVIYQVSKVPTSIDGVYLKNLVCAKGALGQEIRYTIVRGPLAGHPKKMLFIRTYRTDEDGYMRPWSRDNYRWHPFQTGPNDASEQYIELPDSTCDHATHIETSIVRGERRAPPITRCVEAFCSKSKG